MRFWSTSRSSCCVSSQGAAQILFDIKNGPILLRRYTSLCHWRVGSRAVWPTTKPICSAPDYGGTASSRETVNEERSEEERRRGRKETTIKERKEVESNTSWSEGFGRGSWATEWDGSKGLTDWVRWQCERAFFDTYTTGRLLSDIQTNKGNFQML